MAAIVCTGRVWTMECHALPIFPAMVVGDFLKSKHKWYMATSPTIRCGQIVDILIERSLLISAKGQFMIRGRGAQLGASYIVTLI